MILLSETSNKMGRIYEMMVFKILDIIQQRTVIPQSREPSEVSLTTAPAY